MNTSFGISVAHRWLVTATILAVTCASIAVGLLIADGDTLVIALLLALPLTSWLAFAHPGVTVGALWLIALNGVPLLNLQTGVGQLRMSDIAVIAIVLVALLQSLVKNGNRRPLPSSLAIVCAVFGAWWCFTFVRSINVGVPAKDVLLYGRDFLSLVILIPAGWIILRTPKAQRECLVVILLGAGLYSVAYVGGTLGLVNAVSFTHPQQIRSVGNIQRLYTSMNDLVVTVAVFGVATLATTRRNRATPFIAALSAITLLAFLLQLTRAAYLGMAIGGLIGVSIALTRGRGVRRILARRASILFAILAVSFVAIMGVGSGGVPTGIISERITSGVSEFSETSGTVGYRVNLYHQMITILGSDWPVGLGFLHPRDHYFAGLPEGSIRNADVGLMNAVMTMGVIGLLLLYGVLFSVALYVVRTRDDRPAWLVVGILAWLTVVVAGSPTLITLFSPTGLISTGLTLVLCSAYLSRRRPDLASAPPLLDERDLRVARVISR
jgi:hypothetical protein